jgi:hypothetical protein
MEVSGVPVSLSCFLDDSIVPVFMFKVLEIVPIFIWFLRTKGRASMRLNERR